MRQEFQSFLDIANALRGGYDPIEGSSTEIADILSAMFSSVEAFEKAYKNDAHAVCQEIEDRLG